MVPRPSAGSGSRALTSPDPWLPVEAVIRQVREESHDTRTYTLVFEDPSLQESYSFRAGQFNSLGFPGLGEAAVSFSSAPSVRGSFQHTIRAVGDVTRTMFRMQPGDVVGIRGPFGRPWPMEEARGRDLLVVAGGIGMSPLRSILEEVFLHREEYGEITVLYGARTPADLLFTADLDRWSAQPGTTLLLTVDRTEGQPWRHHIGVVPTLFGRAKLSPRTGLALVCGPEVMMKFVVIELQRRGFHDERIFLSMERRMRCGVAQCGHCFLGPKFVCQDGPVFRYSDLSGLLGKGV